ncbi:DUF7385 family protein [Halorubrum sp. SY-15]|jgi:hypothetical protein|uniref:DUF7385 family protein n=1 Tax=Halorubrum sp. SY-15 TaxID=3402277 RepID=UPI003EC0B24E
MVAFDVHEHRHALKLLRDTGPTTLWRSNGAARCPACDEPFVRLFVTEAETTSIARNDGSAFCLLRDAESIKLFRH